MHNTINPRIINNVQLVISWTCGKNEDRADLKMPQDAVDDLRNSDNQLSASERIWINVIIDSDDQKN